MADSGQRFWAVSIPFGMIIGLILAHVGRVRTRRVASGRRHRIATIFYGLALLVILASVPWPLMPNGRPMFRW